MKEFRAVVFDGRKTAGKALDKLQDDKDLRWTEDVAVVSRNKHGMIRVNSTWAQDDRDLTGGIGLGALTGGVIGAMMGPAGAIAGAVGAGALAGGSLGAIVGATVDLAVEDPKLEEFASRLKDDTSALILGSDAPVADEFVSAFGPDRGVIVETRLNEHDVKALSEALKADRKRAK